MDSCSGESLSFLYKNDPFYSLCLSDLLSAPQSVIDQFLKEQRNLTESLKRIDRCQLSRIAQLNNEKREFALLMSRRLAPKNRPLSSLEGDKESRRSLSTRNCSNISSAKSSTQNFETMSTASSYRTGQARSLTSSSTEWYNGRGHMKKSQHFFVTLLPIDRYQHGPTSKLLTRSERCLSALQSENISKTISRAAYRVK